MGTNRTVTLEGQSEREKRQNTNGGLIQAIEYGWRCNEEAHNGGISYTDEIMKKKDGDPNEGSVHRA